MNKSSLSYRCLYFSSQFVFCRQCRQGYHLGECSDVEAGDTEQPDTNCQYSVDPVRASQVSNLNGTSPSNKQTLAKTN